MTRPVEEREPAARAIEWSGADFGVGLEGGLQQVETQWFNSGWAVVVGRSKTEGIGTTIRMAVPATVMALVLAGAELGDACDQVFAVTESKRTSGLLALRS
jgi:non-canonical (house-cleaning) NTP pyrophosphatase